jgi:hypothetical protein
MIEGLLRALDDRRLVYAASLFTIALGLFFVFVRAPHPWGWEGIDHYHDFAQILARGEPFPTTDVPWGYAYFVAFFYKIAGPKAWVPVAAQALLNGLLPLLVYLVVRRDFGERVGITAAVLTGLFSFNTIYASTESTDSVCTVLFFGSLAAFARARSRHSLMLFAVAGVLIGIASQFRPNLILFAPVLALATLVFGGQARRDFGPVVLYGAAAALIALPWTIRNYRLTGELIPTSTHGGVQLWYGSLQTGPYLTSRAYNPRSAFERASFDYTSLDGRPITIAADCGPEDPAAVTLTWWTDRDRTERTIQPAPPGFTFTVPGQPAPTVLYYFFTDRLSGGRSQLAPPDGAADPFVFFVSDQHLADLDRHGDVLDAFDFARMVQAVAWHEPMPQSARFDFDRDGAVTEHDVRLAAAALSPRGDRLGMSAPDVVRDISVTPQEARVGFVDGSALLVPRAPIDRITDLVPTGEMAAEIAVGRRRTAALPVPKSPPNFCRPIVNAAFYQREPHMMRRYTALAFDNIRRDPAGFLISCAYRSIRLFVVQGTDDSRTAQQFEGSGMVYRLAAAASGSYLALAIAGLVVAIRRHNRIWFLLMPIVYITATLCFVLTNMRYTVTVQPLLFAFGALAVTAALERLGRSGAIGLQ